MAETTTIRGAEYEEYNRSNFANRNIKVSVWCITYNHRLYIEDALKGLISQKRNFLMEVVIIDDASTDGTTDIVKKYAEKYPDIFHLYVAKVNIYGRRNRDDIYMCIQQDMFGQYFAVCEGDDYWNDPNKLQMQVDFLEGHPECVLTLHGAKLLDCRDDSWKDMRPFEEGWVSERDLIMETSCIIPTASAVGKKEVFSGLSAFPGGPVGDKRLWLNALCLGKIYYMDRIMSVYRYWREGSWTAIHEQNLQYKNVMYTRLADFFIRFAEYADQYKGLAVKKAKRYCYANIHNSEQLSIPEFDDTLASIGKYVGKWLEKLVEAQKEIFRYIHDIDYMGQNLLDFCKENTHLYIYGTGDFGSKMARRLGKNGVEFAGFVVSDEITNLQQQADNVYSISDLMKLQRNIAVIVAVGGHLEDEIQENLNKGNITNYIAPYWMELG